MFKTHRAIAVSAAAALTFGGIIGGGIVLAEDPTTTPPPATSAPEGPNLQGALDDYIAKLAENLGVDETTLRDAIKQTNLDFLDQAVADGKLTEEQAADIRARLEEGTDAFFGLGPLHLPRDHEGRGPLGGIFGGREEGGSLNIIGAIGQATEETAAFLGITEDELRTQLGNGKSLAEIAEASSKTRDELKEFLTTRANEEIDAMVASGALTEERASMLKDMLGNNIDHLIDATRPEKGARMFPGFGGGPNIERHRFEIAPDDDGDSSDAIPDGPSSFRGSGSTAPDYS